MVIRLWPDWKFIFKYRGTGFQGIWTKVSFTVAWCVVVCLLNEYELLHFHEIDEKLGWDAHKDPPYPAIFHVTSPCTVVDSNIFFLFGHADEHGLQTVHGWTKSPGARH